MEPGGGKGALFRAGVQWISEISLDPGYQGYTEEPVSKSQGYLEQEVAYRASVRKQKVNLRVQEGLMLAGSYIYS